MKFNVRPTSNAALVMRLLLMLVVAMACKTVRRPSDDLKQETAAAPSSDRALYQQLADDRRAMFSQLMQTREGRDSFAELERIRIAAVRKVRGYSVEEFNERIRLLSIAVLAAGSRTAAALREPNNGPLISTAFPEEPSDDDATYEEQKTIIRRALSYFAEYEALRHQININEFPDGRRMVGQAVKQAVYSDIWGTEFLSPRLYQRVWGRAFPGEDDPDAGNELFGQLPVEQFHLLSNFYFRAQASMGAGIIARYATWALLRGLYQVKLTGLRIMQWRTASGVVINASSTTLSRINNGARYIGIATAAYFFATIRDEDTQPVQRPSPTPTNDEQSNPDFAVISAETLTYARYAGYGSDPARMDRLNQFFTEQNAAIEARINSLLPQGFAEASNLQVQMTSELAARLVADVKIIAKRDVYSYMSNGVVPQTVDDIQVVLESAIGEVGYLFRRRVEPKLFL